MRVIKDLVGGSKPQPIPVLYNGELAADSTTKRYAGSVVKLMDFDDVDHGRFFTFGGVATIGEGVAGLLAEEQPTSGNYLLDDASYGAKYRLIEPCGPMTLVEAEYAQADAAGTSNLDTNFTGAAAGTTLTCGDGTTTADYLIGGWVYFTNGNNEGYLHYITNSDNAGAITLATALTAAVVATDDLLVILPPHTQKCLFDATYTGIKSDCDDATWTSPIMGLSTWISAPGIAKTKLSRDLHDGLKIANAKFFHQFTFAGTIANAATTKPNLWSGMNV